MGCEHGLVPTSIFVVAVTIHHVRIPSRDMIHFLMPGYQRTHIVKFSSGRVNVIIIIIKTLFKLLIIPSALLLVSTGEQYL